jgi:hypothetical protein
LNKAGTHVSKNGIQNTNFPFSQLNDMKLHLTSKLFNQNYGEATEERKKERDKDDVATLA